MNEKKNTKQNPHFPQMAEKQQQKCGECGKSVNAAQANKRCGKCKLVYYCSRECQKLQWQAHKPMCKPMPQRLHPIASSDIEDFANCLKLWEVQAHKTAVQCSCAKCAAECKHVPGIYSPQQVLDLFAAEGAACFDKMSQDYRLVEFGGEECVIFYLTPATAEEVEGQVSGSRRDGMTYGICMHLGPNGCTLDRKTQMPLGCLIAHPCRTKRSTRDMDLDLQNQGAMWMAQLGVETMLMFEKHQAAKGKKVGIDQDFATTARLLRFTRASMSYMKAKKENNSDTPPHLVVEFGLLHNQEGGEEMLAQVMKTVSKQPQQTKDYLLYNTKGI